MFDRPCLNIGAPCVGISSTARGIPIIGGHYESSELNDLVLCYYVPELLVHEVSLAKGPQSESTQLAVL